MPAIMPHLELQMPELDPEDIKEEDETSYNHEVVLNLLQRLLDTKDPLSLTDAADRLLDMVYDGEKDHNEYSFECMVKGLAEQIPSDHSAQNELAQLLWKLAPYENMVSPLSASTAKPLTCCRIRKHGPGIPVSCSRISSINAHVSQSAYLVSNC